MVIKFKYKELLAILTEVATVIDDSLANEDMKNIIFEIKNGVGKLWKKSIIIGNLDSKNI